MDGRLALRGDLVQYNGLLLYFGGDKETVKYLVCTMHALNPFVSRVPSEI